MINVTLSQRLFFLFNKSIVKTKIVIPAIESYLLKERKVEHQTANKDETYFIIIGEKRAISGFKTDWQHMGPYFVSNNGLNIIRAIQDNVIEINMKSSTLS